MSSSRPTTPPAPGECDKPRREAGPALRGVFLDDGPDSLLALHDVADVHLAVEVPGHDVVLGVDDDMRLRSREFRCDVFVLHEADDGVVPSSEEVATRLHLCDREEQHDEHHLHEPNLTSAVSRIASILARKVRPGKPRDAGKETRPEEFPRAPSLQPRTTS